MVQSLLDNTIQYNETSKINETDKESDKEVEIINYILQTTMIPPTLIYITLGKRINTFQLSHHIVYYPIYWYQKNETFVPIGLFEFKDTNPITHSITLPLASIPLEKWKPIIYQRITHEILLTKRYLEKDDSPSISSSSSELSDSTESSLPSSESLSSTSSSSSESTPTLSLYSGGDSSSSSSSSLSTFFTDFPFVKELLPEETSEQSILIREGYQEEPNKTYTWIERYMENHLYSVLENDGNSDCLFFTIQDAFSQIGKRITIKELRKYLSNEMTETIFQQKKNISDIFLVTLEESMILQKELEEKHKQLKREFRQTDMLNKQKKYQLVEQAQHINEQFIKISNEIHQLQQSFSSYTSLEKIITVSSYREYIQSQSFWADPWTLYTFEQLFHIKFLLLNQQAFEQHDSMQILHFVTDMKDPIMVTNLLSSSTSDKQKKKGSSSPPDYYILLTYIGNHYQLISYKNTRIFTFQEIPYDIKKMIVYKCMELDKNESWLSFIPDLRLFKKKEKIHFHSLPYKEEKQIQKYHHTNLYDTLPYYNESIVFYFYSHSNEKPFPGTAIDEKIPIEMIKQYSFLASIPNWRQKLTNTWIQSFEYDHLHWASVEHYYQASKFKQKYPVFYEKFALNENEKDPDIIELSTKPEIAMAAGSLSGKYKGKIIRPPDIQLDIQSHYIPEEAENELFHAQMAKFSQHNDLKQLLLETHEATLIHCYRKKRPILCHTLMSVRRTLQKTRK